MRRPQLDLIALLRGPEPFRERRAQARGVGGTAAPQPRAALDEALGPGVQVARARLEGGVSLREHALELPELGPVRRPERRRLPVEKLPAVAHRAVYHAQPLARVDDDVEAAVVLRGTHVAAVDPERPPSRLELDLELGRALVVGFGRRDKEARAAPDDARRVVGAERAAARDEADRLEKRRLALPVLAHEHVQPGSELELRLTDVAQVADPKLLQPDQPPPS